MTPAEAYDIVENPEDYSAAKVKQAEKVLRNYAEVTERDRTPPRKKMTKPTPPPKGRKAQMMRGGMANGKVHMYSAGGSVKDLNPGLRALQKERPDVVAKILKNK